MVRNEGFLVSRPLWGSGAPVREPSTKAVEVETVRCFQGSGSGSDVLNLIFSRLLFTDAIRRFYDSASITVASIIDTYR